MGNVLDVGESMPSNYLDTVKHIQGDGVCESLAVLESSKVLAVEAHWINGGDYGNSDSGVSGNYECIHGACCRVLGEVPTQNYLLPVWQYKNRSVSLEGAFKIWKLPRKKYLSLVALLATDGLDMVDYDIHLVDNTKNSQYPDYTIQIGRHKSELTKEWRTAYVAKNFGANLMDIMDVSIERRMDKAKWDELLFEKLKLVEAEGNELRHSEGGVKALPGEAPVNKGLPPMDSQAVPVEAVPTKTLPPQDIKVESRVATPIDEEVAKSANDLNSLLDDKGAGGAMKGLPSID
jgi:hypothetical protein